MEKLPTAQSGYNALSPQQQKDHRAKIGVRASSILRQFWREDGLTQAEEALEVEGWMDVLENCSHSEIRAAWAAYQKTGPRTQAGKLYKPDAGALYQIILSNRPKPKIVDERRPATREEDEAYRKSVARDKINEQRKAEAEAIMAQFKTGSRD